MVKKTQTASCLFMTLVVAWLAAGCSGDDTATTSVGGSGGSTTSTNTTTTNGGAGGAGGRIATDGSGGSAGGAMTDVGLPDIGAPQAGTAVILIDNVIVAQKPPGEAGTDAAQGAAEGGGAADSAVDGGGISDVVLSDGAGAVGVSYTFDSDVEGWHYTSFASTPNIGFMDPGASPRPKLSDPTVSQLEFDSTNDADGRVDASGALKLTVGFYAANDQIAVQAFSVRPNDATQWKVWRGFIATAKIKLVSGGNLDPACPIRARISISTGAGYVTVLSPPVNLTAGIDWATLTFDFDTVAPGESGFDLTQVNQLGIQANTGVCAANPG